MKNNIATLKLEKGKRRKGEGEKISFSPFHPFSLSIALISVLLLPAAPALSAVPEPDTVLYGSIVFSNQLVTAAQSDVVVEARRTMGGPVIASYRMGTTAGLGSFYSLRLKLEAPGTLTDTNASQIGNILLLEVRDNSGLRAQTNYTVVERGRIQRFNFGPPVNDVEGNGIPDVWELAHLGAAGAANLDSDGDGQSDAAEYRAGTDPLDPNDGFRININRTAGQTKVFFHARRAQGPGYEGLSRYYTLQNAGDLGAPAWSGVAGVMDVVGNEQEVAHFPASSGPNTFYRGQVSLAPGSFIPDNGLPDAWEIAYLGSAGQNPDADPDLDGRTTAEEFVSGTHPGDPDDVFRVTISESAGTSSISFVARKAEGVGYEGLSRLFTLETTVDLGGPGWSAVPGLLNITGNNQTVTHQTPATNSPSFYRSRVQLQGP